MAAGADALPGVGLRNHASADAGRDRRPVLPAFHTAVSNGHGTRGRAARRGAAPVVRPWLLRAGAQSAPGGRDRPRASCGRGTAGLRRHQRTAGCRTLDGRRDPRPRLRPAPPDPRRQRQARAGALVRSRRLPRRGPRRGAAVAAERTRDARRRGPQLHPGDHGSRRNRLHARSPGLHGVPDRAALLRTPGRPATGDSSAAAAAAASAAWRMVARRASPRRGAARAAAAGRHLGRAVGVSRVRIARGGGARCLCHRCADRRGHRVRAGHPRIHALRSRGATIASRASVAASGDHGERRANVVQRARPGRTRPGGAGIRAAREAGGTWSERCLEP